MWDLGFGPQFLRQVGFGWSWFLREFPPDRPPIKDTPPVLASTLLGEEKSTKKMWCWDLTESVPACPRTVVGRAGVIWREEAEIKTLLFS